MSGRLMSTVALARLLLARFNHSIGSSGGRRSGGIDDLALANRRIDDQGRTILVPFDFLRRHHNHIHRLSNADEVHVDVFNKVAAMELSPLDHEKVHIAVEAHLTTSSGAEHDNLIRL